MNGRLFVRKVAAEMKLRTKISVYVTASSLHNGLHTTIDSAFRKTFKASTSEMTSPRLHS